MRVWNIIHPIVWELSYMAQKHEIGYQYAIPVNSFFYAFIWMIAFLSVAWRLGDIFAGVNLLKPV